MAKIEIGKVYKPSEVSFEDKDTRIKPYQVGMGRVFYINTKTKEYGEISKEDFDCYYTRARKTKSLT